MSTMPKKPSTVLPWYTWVLPLPMFLASSAISLLFKFDTGVGSFYLPTALAVILVNWWGPLRVLPSLYISAVALTPLWGVENWVHWFIYPLCETIYTIISWLLFTKLLNGKYWLPDTKEFIKFVIAGIGIPLVVDLLLLQSLLTYFNEQPPSLFWSQTIRNWLGEFTANFGICTAVLFSATAFMQKRNLLLHPLNKSEFNKISFSYGELFFALIAVTLLTLIIPFEKYWFIYGIVGLFLAIRNGFEAALFYNLYVFLITYIAPAYSLTASFFMEREMDSILSIFLGNILLAVFVAVTGRAISDLRNAEHQLQKQFEEITETNQELDKFTYSVSHDLSAPLKSIQGLVNISKIDGDASNREAYVDKIGQSVTKLDHFIKEILDYSRNKRLAVARDNIVLQDLCDEILESLRYMDQVNSISVDFSGLNNAMIQTDRLRLKIVLTNLFSNAIKFQHESSTEPACIRVGLSDHASAVELVVSDNGQGIRPEIITQVFDMFFRDHHHTTGSGLGLYIAKQTIHKLGGDIKVISTVGVGTTFYITLPK